MEDSKRFIGSGRPGSLTNRLHQRNPEPVTQVFDGVTDRTEVVTINPVDGFVADVCFRIRRSSATITFQLVDGNGDVLDDVDVIGGGNGELRLLWQQSELPLNVAVIGNGSTFDVTMNVLRHRITGIV